MSGAWIQTSRRFIGGDAVAKRIAEYVEFVLENPNPYDSLTAEEETALEAFVSIVKARDALIMVEPADGSA